MLLFDDLDNVLEALKPSSDYKKFIVAVSLYLSDLEFIPREQKLLIMDTNKNELLYSIATKQEVEFYRSNTDQFSQKLIKKKTNTNMDLEWSYDGKTITLKLSESTSILSPGSTDSHEQIERATISLDFAVIIQPTLSKLGQTGNDASDDREYLVSETKSVVNDSSFTFLSESIDLSLHLLSSSLPHPIYD